jgi:outer membrane protease
MALNVVYSSMQDGYDQKWTMVYLGIIGTYLWENVKQLCDVIWPILDLFS